MSCAIELVLEFAHHDSRQTRTRVSLGKDWLPSSTLEDVMHHPSALNVITRAPNTPPNQQFTLRYLQTVISESEWSRTTLRKLMGLSKAPTATAATTTTRALFMLDTMIPQEPPHDNNKTHDNNRNNHNIQKAMDTLLKQNFDADSKVCIVTLLKMIENLLQQPTNSKVRSIRVGNPTFHSKVASRPGGVDILMACGFTRETPSPGLLSSTNNDTTTTATTMLVLLPSNESTSTLIEARSRLVQCALQQLQMTHQELPKQKPPPPPVTVGKAAASTSQSQSSSSFDPYKAQRHDGASSAAGMKVTPDSTYVSTTEKQLHHYQQKQTKLEQQSNSGGFQRQLVAGLPGTTSTHHSASNSASRNVDVAPPSSQKGDGSLLAQQFQKRQQERLAREEGGFTTKAMRDLEKMKTQKVYKFVSLKIQFADGSHVQGKFRPYETVATLVKIIQEECLVWPDAQFDVYVAPPRRLLQSHKTLKEEGLVPAAKVFVSWKLESTPSEGTPVGSFLKPELFTTKKDEEQQQQFPNGIPLVGGDTTKSTTRTTKSQENKNSSTATTAEEREEEMMKRMMGGRGRKTKSKLVGGTTKKTTNNKPKWFK